MFSYLNPPRNVFFFQLSESSFFRFLLLLIRRYEHILRSYILVSRSKRAKRPKERETDEEKAVEKITSVQNSACPCSKWYYTEVQPMGWAFYFLFASFNGIFFGLFLPFFYLNFLRTLYASSVRCYLFWVSSNSLWLVKAKGWSARPEKREVVWNLHCEV